MRAARKSSMSDMTDEQWELLKEFIPAAKTGGRPRKVEVREEGHGGYTEAHRGRFIVFGWDG
jgi:transposase